MALSPNDDLNERKLTEAAAENWERYWENACAKNQTPSQNGFGGKLKRFLRHSGGWELAYRIIKREAGNPTGKRILEAGCGTGDTSLRLARRGNEVLLLDTSISALKYARRRALDLGFEAFLVRGSIFHLPFKDGVFDFAFNVGVLDHFGPEHRGTATREMIRTVKNQSRVAILTNDARSFIHPLAMKHALKKGTWPFGFKDAIYSLNNSLEKLPSDCAIREYSRGFISQFEFLHYYFPQNGSLKRLYLRLFYLLSFPLNFLNRLPGQYLITVMEKPGKPLVIND